MRLRGATWLATAQGGGDSGGVISTNKTTTSAAPFFQETGRRRRRRRTLQSSSKATSFPEGGEICHNVSSRPLRVVLFLFLVFLIFFLFGTRVLLLLFPCDTSSSSFVVVGWNHKDDDVDSRSWLLPQEYLHPSVLAPPPLTESQYLPCLHLAKPQEPPNLVPFHQNGSSSTRCPTAVDLIASHRSLPQQQQDVRRRPVTTNQTAALCLFLKHESLYMTEFVDYHLALGFDQIYIYDNGATPQETNNNNNKNPPLLLNRPGVVVTSWPGTDQQIPAYHHCWQTLLHTTNHTWMALLDVDEYIVLKKTNKNQKKHSLSSQQPSEVPHIVDDFLQVYCQTGSVSVYWHVFGHANQTRYRPYPLTQRFRYRSAYPSPGGYKSMARIAHVTSVHVHDIKVHDKKHTGNTTTRLHKNYTQHNVFGHDMGKKTTQRLEGPQLLQATNTIAAIHHYWVKSLEEWYIKSCWRGRPVAGPSMQESSNNSNPLRHKVNCHKSWATTTRPPVASDVYDDTAWQTLKQLVPAYASLEQPPQRYH